jgi:hypothetical protein
MYYKKNINQLSAARETLHNAVKEAQWLTTITPLYDNFYKEIDNFLERYAQLKKEGKI